MAKVAAEKKKPFITIGAGTAPPDQRAMHRRTRCTTPTTPWRSPRAPAPRWSKQGGKTWYFLTADYAFGQSLEKDTAATSSRPTAARCWARCGIRCRRRTSRRSCCRRRASKAQILGLANAGGDTINSIKAAKEFGITKTMKIAGPADVHQRHPLLGLQTTQGLYLTDSWYWDQNDETREWAKRFFDKMKQMPSSLQAADYSADDELPEGGEGGRHRRCRQGHGAAEEA